MQQVHPLDPEAEQVAATGYCAHPVRLRGRVEHADPHSGEVATVYSTNREPDATLLKACGNRRASVCPSCSATYQADSFQTFDANPSTRAWLITLEAEAHALAGNERAALIAPDAADTAMTSASEVGNSRRPRSALFSPARLVGERGVALARLQRPQAAQQVLESALASLDPEVIKTRPRLMAALASAHVRQGNIDEACRLGSKALDLAARQQLRRTSRTYADSASTWSPGGRAERSRN